MLEIEAMTVNYGAVTAVNNVSLRVDGGEYVAVVGANGAGKSSLLMAIVGCVRGAGRITFEDESIAGAKPEAIVARGISLVPEGRNIFGGLSVEDNLVLGASRFKRGHGREEGMERVLETFPDLKRFMSTPAGRLSGGEQQQLAIGRALMAQPHLLLLDEPSLGLAPKIVDRVFAALRRLSEEGQSIVLVEQFAARALEETQRAYVMRRGSVVAAGNSRELRGVEEMYLGNELGELR